MKSIKLLSNLTLLLILFSTTQCSTGERSVSVNSVRPADINVPSEVKSILILDRTKFDKSALSVLEGVLTGELPEEDKASMQSLTNAMRDELSGSPRFSVKLASEQLKGNSLTSAFPESLDWSKIDELCTKYNTDAVLAVEIFDTDFIITNGVRKKKKKVTEGGETKEIEVDEFYATGINNMKMGIRVYNPKSKEIIDQKIFKESGNWNAAAASKTAALLALINKADANRHLSARIGADYAYRISPMSVMITRKFRGKSRKTPALEEGSRLADVGNWKEAIKVWETGLSTDQEKDRRYLSFNIAVAYEILGNMDMAKKWASDSYTRYGNNDAKIYLDLINRRINNERIAEKQIQQKDE